MWEEILFIKLLLFYSTVNQGDYLVRGFQIGVFSDEPLILFEVLKNWSWSWKKTNFATLDYGNKP